MELLLGQHGEARMKDEDRRRAQTARGAEDIGRIPIRAARHGVKVDEMRPRGRLRARETVEALGRQACR